VIWADDKWRCEGDIEKHLFAGDRAFTASELVWEWIDAVNYRIKGGEVRIEHRRSKAELPGDIAVTRGEIIVRRRICSSEDAAVGRIGRVKRKDMIKLDLNLVYEAERRTRGQQSNEGGTVDAGHLCGDEVVGCLGLESAGASGTRGHRYQPVGVTCTDKKAIGSGRNSRQEPDSQ
jgi:hypothetical protein